MITKTGQELLTKEAILLRQIPAAFRAAKSTFSNNFARHRLQTPGAGGFLSSIRYGLGQGLQKFRQVGNTPPAVPRGVPKPPTPQAPGAQPAQPQGRSFLGKVGLGVGVGGTGLAAYGTYNHFNNQVQQPHNQPQHFQQLPQPQYYR